MIETKDYKIKKETALIECYKCHEGMEHTGYFRDITNFGKDREHHRCTNPVCVVSIMIRPTPELKQARKEAFARNPKGVFFEFPESENPFRFEGSEDEMSLTDKDLENRE